MKSAELTGSHTPASRFRERETPEFSDATKSGRLESWLARNSGWLAIGMITAALALRLFLAASCYLNPDEALHFNSARPSTWFEAYKASRVLTHPPLFIMVLHWILPLGRSELILRLPSILGGVAALWLTFAWIRRILGEIPALVGLLFMAVSPASLSASTEVRQYGLLLFFLSGALYATERALSEHSARWALIQGLFLLCALLTHYIALVVIAALDIYVLLRSLLDRTPRRILFTLAVGQLSLAVVLGLLYVRNIRHSPAFSREGLAYLAPYYYVKAKDTLLGFSWNSFRRTFSYMIGTVNHELTYVAIFVFLAGLAALLTSRTRARRHVAILILLPFAVGFVTALCRVFPFAGTRHQAYLLPFLAADLAAAFTWIPSGLTAPSLLIGTMLAPLWVASTTPDNSPWVRPISDAKAMVDYIQGVVPLDAPLFVDEETRLVLCYYLGRNDPNLDTWNRDMGNDQRLEGHRIISPNGYVWSFNPNEAITQVNDSAKALGVSAGNSLWIVSVRWPKTEPLASGLPAGSGLKGKEFGTISVIQLGPQ